MSSAGKDVHAVTTVRTGTAAADTSPGILAQEHAERRTGLQRLLLVGCVAWPFFFLTDVAATLSEHRAEVLPRLAVVRLVGWVLVVAVYLPFARARDVTDPVMDVIDFAVPAFIGALVGVRALVFGGLDSTLAMGLMVVGLLRATILPSHWLRTFLVSMAAVCAYPVVMGLAAWRMPELREEWAGPTLRHFISTMVLCTVSVAVGALGSHFNWVARRQMFQARRLGRYRMTARIGSGGHGDLWMARQEQLDRDVAVKVLKRGATDPESIRRFEREALAASQLRHPNTIRIFDFGASNDGVFFIAMELLEGLDLESLVERVGALPPARAIHLARQACESLAEAHKAGIVHRDIKPANLFVTHVGDEMDFLKVLDFGVARLPESAMTASGIVLGTPAYMAPEICEGDRADARSDVYSLGAVLYYLLTATPVFHTRTFSETIQAHLKRKPERPSTRHEGVPTDVEEIVLRCLAKDPAARFATARDLDQALAACESARRWSRDDARTAWADMPPPSKSLQASQVQW
jgi:serine/threonine-protein kinase